MSTSCGDINVVGLGMNGMIASSGQVFDHGVLGW